MTDLASKLDRAIRHPSPDRTTRVEAQRNHHRQTALYLLKLIKEDLDPSSFTLQDIKNTFSDLTEGVIRYPTEKYLDKKHPSDSPRINFGQSHLDLLLAEGYLEDNGDDSFKVNHDFNDDLNEFYRNQIEFN